MDKQFLKDVKSGLTSSPKSLSSKYFYDQAGDKLFQQIMALDEYYLTDCEYEIFTSHRASLLDCFESECELFHLVEFGAGDALKTKVLLKYFLDQNVAFEYNPIDISANVLEKLAKDLKHNLPQLSVQPMNHEYFNAVEEMSNKSTCKKVILFLGSNIGNFSEKEADVFFGRLAEVLQPGDQLLTGFDLKKDPEVILAAYNDSKGVTREFNLNLLRRTAPNIVTIVAEPNTRTTMRTPKKPIFAAGYISMGIKGSHGPKTKMAKSAQGVMLERPAPLWT